MPGPDRDSQARPGRQCLTCTTHLVDLLAALDLRRDKQAIAWLETARRPNKTDVPSAGSTRSRALVDVTHLPSSRPGLPATAPPWRRRAGGPYGRSGSARVYMVGDRRLLRTTGQEPGLTSRWCSKSPKMPDIGERQTPPSPWSDLLLVDEACTLASRRIRCSLTFTSTASRPPWSGPGHRRLPDRCLSDTRSDRHRLSRSGRAGTRWSCRSTAARCTERRTAWCGDNGWRMVAAAGSWRAACKR